MMRLVNADALVDRVEKFGDAEDLCRVIRECDLIEVTRCLECRYRTARKTYEFCEVWEKPTRLEAFCSYGREVLGKTVAPQP